MVVHLPHTHPDKILVEFFAGVGEIFVFHDPVEAVLSEPARPLVAPPLAGPTQLIARDPLADPPHALGANGQPVRITQEPIRVMKTDREPLFTSRPPDLQRGHPEQKTRGR